MNRTRRFKYNTPESLRIVVPFGIFVTMTYGSTQHQKKNGLRPIQIVKFPLPLYVAAVPTLLTLKEKWFVREILLHSYFIPIQLYSLASTVHSHWHRDRQISASSDHLTLPLVAGDLSHCRVQQDQSTTTLILRIRIYRTVVLYILYLRSSSYAGAFHSLAFHSAIVWPKGCAVREVTTRNNAGWRYPALVLSCVSAAAFLRKHLRLTMVAQA